MAPTVLAVVPHPDDAEFFAGGTLARFAREGARVLIVIATDGRVGSYRQAGDALADVRRAEAAAGAAALGAEPPIFLGYRDFELDRLAPGELREACLRQIRLHRPDILIAQAPHTADEPHPDHRALAWAAYEAVSFGALPELHPEHRAEGLEPHFVAEKYYYGGSRLGDNRVVDISETFEVKVAAMLAHASQVEFLVEDVLRQARLVGPQAGALLAGATPTPADAMRYALAAEAGAVGQAAGCRYGERFRYVRFHPLVETALAGAQPS